MLDFILLGNCSCVALPPASMQSSPQPSRQPLLRCSTYLHPCRHPTGEGAWCFCNSLFLLCGKVVYIPMLPSGEGFQKSANLDGLQYISKRASNFLHCQRRIFQSINVADSRNHNLGALRHHLPLATGYLSA